MANKELFSLGYLYPSDFLKEGELPRCNPVELKLVMNGDGFAHLETMAPAEVMWGKYWYRSGTNQSMTSALSDVVHSILPLVTNHKAGDIWLDIACNDGTLLSKVPQSFKRIGIDPCDGDILKSAREHGIIIQDYFSALALYRARLFPPHAKVITSIAVFYDVQNPDEFVKDIREVLDDEGIWVLQLSYTPLMLEQLAFDNICHEHYAYYSLSSIKTLVERNGMEIVDCTLNDVNGGSFRVFVKKKGSSFATQQYRDVCNMRINSLLEMEKRITWDGFYMQILKLRLEVMDFIRLAKRQGERIMGYGASTKGNTLLQWFGLDDTLIDAIAERQEAKWGLRTVGTNIPIISEEEMRRAQPDYLLILPWHFVGEFKERERDYLNKGGKFIVPCPKFQIISA